MDIISHASLGKLVVSSNRQRYQGEIRCPATTPMVPKGTKVTHFTFLDTNCRQANRTIKTSRQQNK
jgi:hypothetical protein